MHSKTQNTNEIVQINSNEIDKPQTSKTITKKPKFRSKVFKISDSYLTELQSSEQFRTVYNIFWVILFLLAVQTMREDYFNYKRIYLGARTLKNGFRGIEYALGCWCLEHLIVFLTFYGFKLWAQTNSSCKRQNAVLPRRLVNLLALVVYIALLLLVGYMASACCLRYKLAFASAMALMLESVRLLMKMHAFVRSSAAAVDSAVHATDTPHLATFAQYLYFLFAPTLIFRTAYPRTDAPIRWSFVLARLLEVAGIMFYYCFLHEHFISVHFMDFGTSAFSLDRMTASLFNMLLPCTVELLFMFYLLLHAVQNCFAELLHFGDRSFYSCWWTVSSYAAYFRTWNWLVQDWLYEYVYKDVYTHVCQSRVASSLVVFTLSALVHEYIMSFVLHLFLPLLYVLFGMVSVGFVYATPALPQRLGNVFMWFTLIVGNALLVAGYSMEYYARINCPKEYRSITDYIVPNLFSCFPKYT